MTIAPQPTLSPATLREVDPLLIDLDPTQPRQEIDPDAQADLEASVREIQGIRTPIMVVTKGDGRYQLLYGERRLRAVQATMLPCVPCLVVAQEDAPNWTEALDIQLIENLCRAELRPLELAQSLWRRILGAQIEALEEEQGDDGSTTAQLLANSLTPPSQIAALEDRLCQLAGVASVADYFGGGRVRVPRKAILSRYGMADWSESRLKKLFQTLDVAVEVQDMLAGVDVSARALRDLGKRAPAEQADLVTQAKTAAAERDGDVGAALRGALEPDKAAKKKASQAPKQTTLDDDLTDDQVDAPAADLAGDLGGDREGANTFTPDPSLAFLTSTGGTAPKLVTDRPAPQRGTTPPTSKVGEWSDDHVLQLEGALEAALHLFDEAGVLHFGPDQAKRLRPLWSELVELMGNAMGEA
jgi:ParB/RepB/Spo0J family partition protein